MTCICNKYNIQIEEKEGEWLDPDNKYRRRDDGKKFRFMYFGCPDHNGHTNRIRPTEADALKKANNTH